MAPTATDRAAAKFLGSHRHHLRHCHCEVCGFFLNAFHLITKPAVLLKTG